LVIPRGLLWDYVTCPNYTFEILAWISFSVMTSTAAAYLFALVGFLQMLLWAKQKRSCFSDRLRDLIEMQTHGFALLSPPARARYLLRCAGNLTLLQDRKEVFPARKKLLFPFIL
jgi:hypothetical protein